MRRKRGNRARGRESLNVMAEAVRLAKTVLVDERGKVILRWK